jgi:hypothetical protein
MANPIFNNQQPYNKQQFNFPPQVKELFQQLQSGVSPQQIFQQMSAINPQALQTIQQFARGQNMSSKDLFYMACQQRGINPQDFMEALGLKM